MTLLLAGLVLVAGISGCGAREVRESATPVTIAATTFPASAPIYVAEEEGLFAKHGIDATVRVYDAGAKALDAAVSGEADYATVAETPIVRAVVEGTAFSVIGTMAQIDEANFIVTSRERGIARASDLRGKRVGLVPGTTGDFFLHIYLVVSRVPIEDVEVVEMRPDQLVGALLTGEVDAISTWPPFTTQALDSLGDQAVTLDQPGLYRMSWNLIRPADPGARDVEVDERVLRAIEDAEAFINNEPEKARAILSKRVKIPEDELERQWDNFRWRLQLDQSLVISFDDQARWMLEKRGESTRQPNFLEHIDPEPLRAVSPSSINLVESED